MERERKEENWAIPNFELKPFSPWPSACYGLKWRVCHPKKTGRKVCDYIFHSISTVNIITVQGMQTQPHVQKPPEHSLKWIKWPTMRSSKDVRDKANVLLNTAVAAQIPAALDEQVQGEASRGSLRRQQGKALQAAWPRPASAPVTHLMSSPHPGSVCLS